MKSQTLTAVRYSLTGVLNTCVGLAVIALARGALGFSEYAANAAGYAVGLCVGYVANRQWSFQDSGSPTATFALYCLAFACCYLLNVFVLWFGLNVLGWPGLLAQVLAISAYSVSFFVACRKVVFTQARAG
jgi:putative flippase GtrA